MSPLNGSPFKGTRRSLCEALCLFIKALKRVPVVGVKGVRADFPTVYMVISNLTALVQATIYTLNANHFFSLFLLSFFLQTLDC